MILTIDIGNTTISFAVMEGLKVKRVFDVMTVSSKDRLRAQIKAFVKKVCRLYPTLHEVIICSVVPSALKVVKAVVKEERLCITVIGRDLIVSIKNNYRPPKHVGQDRLVGAFAAKAIFGVPAIIIDFGTAITFDVVSHQGEYEGGMIVPGIQLSAESLFQKTALLPRIDKIRAPKELIGKNTKGSILSGIFYGYGMLSCGLIDLISHKIKGRPKVIVTGGYTHLMKKFIRKKIDKIEPHLVFKGMVLVYQQRPHSSRRT